MQKYLFLLLCFVSLSLTATAQSHKTDSIFDSLNLKFSAEALDNAKREYELANDTIKAIMLKVYSMPMVSRKEMIDNFQKHSAEISNLKKEFTKAVPKDYIVSLEIELSDDPLRSIVSINLLISKEGKDGKLELIDGEWDMQYGSDRLDELLQILKWDPMTFSNIRYMLQMANCISIQNGNITEVGFARSGLGKYTYLIFPTELLTVPQIKEYNDGCEFMYYKKNIVLKYEGGMAGPQCFTD